MKEQIQRGFDLMQAFLRPTQESFTQPKTQSNVQQPSPTSSKVQDDGIKLTIDNPFSKTLIERADTRKDIAYGLAHAPAANVKLFNASHNPDASIALSFSASKENYDDIFKIVKRPNGGYELHLQKINTVVVDGKRIDVESISKFL